MRWTWYYLDETRVLHDDKANTYIPNTCVQLMVGREVETGIAPNKNELEDKVQTQSGRVWLFNYLDVRYIRLRISLFGRTPDSIGEEDLIQARRILAQWFNPQPTAPDGVLTFHSRDAVRAINARYDSRMEWDWVYLDQGEFVTDVQLLCPDPLWYDPNQQSQYWSQSGTESLTLCYELPFTLCEGTGATQNLVNAGDWATYPIIQVFGPAQNVTVTNTTTGESVGATYVLGAGKIATYDFTPGVKTIYDSDGNNLMSTLIQPNDLATFHLACAYEYDANGNLIAPGGVNTIVITSGGTTANALATWYNRYLTS